MRVAGLSALLMGGTSIGIVWDGKETKFGLLHDCVERLIISSINSYYGVGGTNLLKGGRGT